MVLIVFCLSTFTRQWAGLVCARALFAQRRRSCSTNPKFCGQVCWPVLVHLLGFAAAGSLIAELRSFDSGYFASNRFSVWICVEETWFRYCNCVDETHRMLRTSHFLENARKSRSCQRYREMASKRRRKSKLSSSMNLLACNVDKSSNRPHFPGQSRRILHCCALP